MNYADGFPESLKFQIHYADDFSKIDCSQVTDRQLRGQNFQKFTKFMLVKAQTFQDFRCHTNRVNLIFQADIGKFIWYKIMTTMLFGWHKDYLVNLCDTRLLQFRHFQLKKKPQTLQEVALNLDNLWSLGFNIFRRLEN